MFSATSEFDRRLPVVVARMFLVSLTFAAIELCWLLLPLNKNVVF